MKTNLGIKNIMTTDLVTVNANASIDELEGIFKANNFHHVPVLNKEGKLVGIVSREDYYKFHKIFVDYYYYYFVLLLFDY